MQRVSVALGVEMRRVLAAAYYSSIQRQSLDNPSPAMSIISSPISLRINECVQGANYLKADVAKSMIHALARAAVCTVIPTSEWTSQTDGNSGKNIWEELVTLTFLQIVHLICWGYV
jgi:hypothetical protein